MEINANNYWKFCEELEKDPSLHGHEVQRFVRFLKKDFPSSWREALKTQLPRVHRWYFNNSCQAPVQKPKLGEIKHRLNKLIKKTDGDFNSVVAQFSWFDLREFLSLYGDKNASKVEKLYRFTYGVDGDKKCLQCSKKLKFAGLLQGYGTYCSNGCRVAFSQRVEVIDGKQYSFAEYSKLIRQLTERNAFKVKKIEQRSSKHHLDHKLSIAEGFIRKIAPTLVASPANLRIIEAEQNQAKGHSSSISFKELCRLNSAAAIRLR